MSLIHQVINCSGATHSKDVMRAKDRHVFGARRYTQKDLWQEHHDTGR